MTQLYFNLNLDFLKDFNLNLNYVGRRKKSAGGENNHPQNKLILRRAE